MPVYNAEKYIYDSVESILNQTYKDLEILIIDDGSTDKTVSIINRFTDSRIRIYLNEHSGIISQLNFGIEKASGSYIARMDADDISINTRLMEQINYLISVKDIGIVGTNYYLIDEQSRIICYKKMPETNDEIKFMKPILDSILHPTIMLRRSVFDIAGKYNNDYLYSEDDEFFLRSFSKGITMYNIQKPLFKYRISRKPDDYYEIQNKNYYRCSKEYLGNLYKSDGEKSKLFYYHLALLEYYRGDIAKSKNLFLKSFSFRNLNAFIRYFPFTLLGNSVINYLRKRRINEKINILLRNKFKIETNKIKKIRILQ